MQISGGASKLLKIAQSKRILTFLEVLVSIFDLLIWILKGILNNLFCVVCLLQIFKESFKIPDTIQQILDFPVDLTFDP